MKRRHQQSQITDRNRLALRSAIADEVFGAVFDNFESFREDNVGADLAYLLGAILGGDEVDWNPEEYGESVCPLGEFCLRHFKREHPVWHYIVWEKRPKA